MYYLYVRWKYETSLGTKLFWRLGNVYAPELNRGLVHPRVASARLCKIGQHFALTKFTGCSQEFATGEQQRGL